MYEDREISSVVIQSITPANYADGTRGVNATIMVTLTSADRGADGPTITIEMGLPCDAEDSFELIQDQILVAAHAVLERISAHPLDHLRGVMARS